MKPFGMKEYGSRTWHHEAGQSSGSWWHNDWDDKWPRPSQQMNMFNICLKTQHIPALWRKAIAIALLKPGKDPNLPKTYQAISLLWITYKLFKRLLLTCLSSQIDAQLIDNQASFRSEKSCTGQLLNLTQYIEDRYQEKITAIAFVDLTTAYDAVQHRLLVKILYSMMGDAKPCSVIRCLLSSSTCSVSHSITRKADGSTRPVGCHGSGLAPLLFNVYICDQPLPEGCRGFICADDRALAMQ